MVCPKKKGKLLAAANNGKLQKKSVGESQKQQKTIADPQFCSPGKFPTWHPWTAVSHRCGAWPPPERFLGKKNCGKIISHGNQEMIGWLVVSTPKNMKVSWGYYSQYVEKKCSKPPTRRWLGMKATMLLWFYGDFMGYQRILNGYEWM